MSGSGLAQAFQMALSGKTGSRCPLEVIAEKLRETVEAYEFGNRPDGSKEHKLRDWSKESPEYKADAGRVMLDAALDATKAEGETLRRIGTLRAEVERLEKLSDDFAVIRDTARGVLQEVTAK